RHLRDHPVAGGTTWPAALLPRVARGRRGARRPAHRARHRRQRHHHRRHMTAGDAVAADALDAVERCLDAVDTWEPIVHAWAHLDRDGARRHARAADGPLRGVVLGVKDIFDTADLPTEYGSPIYAGHRSRADAGVVALLRAADAVVLG